MQNSVKRTASKGEIRQAIWGQELQEVEDNVSVSCSWRKTQNWHSYSQESAQVFKNSLNFRDDPSTSKAQFIDDKAEG